MRIPSRVKIDAGSLIRVVRLTHGIRTVDLVEQCRILAQAAQFTQAALAQHKEPDHIRLRQCHGRWLRAGAVFGLGLNRRSWITAIICVRGFQVIPRQRTEKVPVTRPAPYGRANCAA
jgi:hypothetical protein